MAVVAATAPLSEVRHYRAHSRLRRVSRGIALAVASMLFLGYVLAPIVWLVSSSFQSEHEIISKPPHWIPKAPTLQNFSAIFAAKDKTVTYETRKGADPASGGFIPSTASNLLPAMLNSFIVATARSSCSTFWSACLPPMRWPRSIFAAARPRSTPSLRLA